MRRERVDSTGQNGNLNLRGSGIALGLTELFYQLLFFFLGDRHRFLISASLPDVWKRFSEDALHIKAVSQCPPSLGREFLSGGADRVRFFERSTEYIKLQQLKAHSVSGSGPGANPPLDISG
jgi:hypothetical protein